MRVRCLDVLKTHQNNPMCPMRLAPTQDGRGLYCVDCGCEIMWSSVEVVEKKLVDKIKEGMYPNVSMGCRVQEDIWREGDEPVRQMIDGKEAPPFDLQKSGILPAGAGDIKYNIHKVNVSEEPQDRDHPLNRGYMTMEEANARTPKQQLDDGPNRVILWYPDDGTCPVCQKKITNEDPLYVEGGEQASFIGRWVHVRCQGKVRLWSHSNEDGKKPIPDRFKFVERNDRTPGPSQFTKSEEELRTYEIPERLKKKIKAEEDLAAAREYVVKKHLIFITGEDVRVEVGDDTLADARETALAQSHNTGRPAEEWEIRNEKGTLLPPSTSVDQFINNERLFLTLKVGIGGDHLCGHSSGRPCPYCAPKATATEILEALEITEEQQAEAKEVVDHILKTAEEEGKDFCSQCGGSFRDLACGPTHAAISAERGYRRPPNQEALSYLDHLAGLVSPRGPDEES